MMVEIPRELQEFVDKLVQSGRFESPSDVMPRRSSLWNSRN